MLALGEIELERDGEIDGLNEALIDLEIEGLREALGLIELEIEGERDGEIDGLSEGERDGESEGETTVRVFCSSTVTIRSNLLSTSLFHDMNKVYYIQKQVCNNLLSSSSKSFRKRTLFT